MDYSLRQTNFEGFQVVPTIAPLHSINMSV